jgi:hypothetical protein
MNAEPAKTKNIIAMAFDFSAMTRVFEKKSTEQIVSKLESTLSHITSLQNDRTFQNLHDGFCQWFTQNIKTAKKSSPASYGQGAKVLDVALKVYVYYCHLPDLKTAEQKAKWLHAAIDTKMLRHLKKYDKEIPDSEAKVVDKDTYGTLQKLVWIDINRRFSGLILPVQWDDIMWRELNNKDKKRAEILEHNQGSTNSSNVCKVRASITGQTNTYKTGVESGQEILEISLSKPGYNKHNIPWANLVGVKLIIGRSIYDGTLNLKRKDGIPWISSAIHDSKGKKLALRTPLIACGYNKGDSVNLQININKKEIAILPLPSS